MKWESSSWSWKVTYEVGKLKSNLERIKEVGKLLLNLRNFPTSLGSFRLRSILSNFATMGGALLLHGEDRKIHILTPAICKWRTPHIVGSFQLRASLINMSIAIKGRDLQFYWIDCILPCLCSNRKIFVTTNRTCKYFSTVGFSLFIPPYWRIQENSSRNFPEI